MENAAHLRSCFIRGRNGARAISRPVYDPRRTLFPRYTRPSRSRSQSARASAVRPRAYGRFASIRDSENSCDGDGLIACETGG